jgi:hypothetical protein
MREARNRSRGYAGLRAKRGEMCLFICGLAGVQVGGAAEADRCFVRCRDMPSTVIRSFLYHPERRTLDVTFVSGRRYRYADVPEGIAQAFREAFSKGRFFNAHIRDDFRYTELADEPVAEEELWPL